MGSKHDKDLREEIPTDKHIAAVVRNTSRVSKSRGRAVFKLKPEDPEKISLK